MVEPEPDVSPEGATSFVTRAQPILANQCMECHARPDHASAFKLIRVTGFEVGPQATHANLRAVASQLKKDDPANSPLLTKALTAHGGMKQPPFVSRQATAFRAGIVGGCRDRQHIGANHDPAGATADPADGAGFADPAGHHSRADGTIDCRTGGGERVAAGWDRCTIGAADTAKSSGSGIGHAIDTIEAAVNPADSADCSTTETAGCRETRGSVRNRYQTAGAARRR